MGHYVKPAIIAAVVMVVIFRVAFLRKNLLGA